MSSLTQLEKAKKKAEERYSQLRQQLQQPTELQSFAKIAQQAQDAWNELKRIETEYNNMAILKKMEMLYHV